MTPTGLNQILQSTQIKVSIMYSSYLALFLIVLTTWQMFSAVEGLRTTLYPGEEPEISEAYYNMRFIFSDPSYFHLRFAGLLEENDIAKKLKGDPKTKTIGFERSNFTFDGSDYIRRGLLLKWMIPFEERTSLQLYDSEEEMKLSAGPQVNQDLCGLQLDYMIHMNDKHNQRMFNSTEYSMFKIMTSYGSPGYGVAIGNSIFPGDYEGCQSENLLITKDELASVNKTAAELYFNNQEEEVESTTLAELGRILRNYIAPFFGFPVDEKKINLDKYRNKVRLQKMRYCMAGLRWPNWPQTKHYRRNFAIRSGICIPETCDSSSLTLYHDQIRKIMDNQMSKYYDEFYIEHLYCLPDENSPFRNPFNFFSSALFIWFNVIWLSLTAIATLLHLSYGQNFNKLELTGWRSYLNTLSLVKSISSFIKSDRMTEMNKTPDEKQALVASKPPEVRVNLEPLEGFKVLSSLSVIISHAMVIILAAPWNPAAVHDLISKSWLAMASTLCPSIVDNFFVATGIITCMIIYKMPRKSLLDFKFWIQFLIYRYIRIVPIYLFVTWFLKSSQRFIGSGPFWDYGTSHSAWSHLCQQESWWAVILPHANFKSPASHCEGVGWYLANDIQFASFTPFIIILYLKKPWLGDLSILGSVLGMMYSHVSYYYRNAKDPRSIFEWSMMTLTRILDDTSAGYVNPQYRSLAYLIGLAAGYRLNEYRKGNVKEWPRWFVKFGRIFILVHLYILCSAPYVTTMLPLDNDFLVRILAALFDGLLHAFTSVASAIFIMLLCTGHLPFINSVYSLPFFRALADMSMSTLLVHIPLMFYHVQRFRILPHMSLYYAIVTSLIWVVESFILGAVVYVVYELPLKKLLLKILFKLFSETSPTSIIKIANIAAAKESTVKPKVN